MPEEIYVFIENGNVTEIKTDVNNVKFIVINLDNRKKGDEPVIEFFQKELKKREFSLNWKTYSTK